MSSKGDQSDIEKNGKRGREPKNRRSVELWESPEKKGW